MMRPAERPGTSPKYSREPPYWCGFVAVFDGEWVCVLTVPLLSHPRPSPPDQSLHVQPRLATPQLRP